MFSLEFKDLNDVQMFKSDNKKMGTKAMQMYIISALYGQYRLCEYQYQLMLPSLVPVFNMFIDLL